MDFSTRVPVSWKICGRVAALLLLFLICTSCGDEFRPVAIPESPPPPDPDSLHYALVLSNNGNNEAGASMRIDVSGDSDVAHSTLGIGPVHAVIVPNGARTYAANRAENTISTYPSSSPTTVSTISLPAGSSPTFLATTDNNSVYVASSGTGMVDVITTVTNVVTVQIPVGLNPIAMVETPDVVPPISTAKKVYVANQGDGTLSIIDAASQAVGNTICAVPVQPCPGNNSPVWLLARTDSARVYALNSAAGLVSVIDTASDTIVSSVSVGAGANYMVYDARANHLYVVNPAANTVAAIDVSVDPTAPLYTVNVAPSPLAVAVLPDSSRFYVASDACSNGAISSCAASGGTATSQLSVFSTSDGRLRSVIALGTVATDPVNPTGCDGARFRVFAAAAADSSRVYVSNCDGGFTDIVLTATDTLLQGQQFQVTNTNPMTCELVTAPAPLPSPLSVFPPSVNTCEITQNQQFFFLVPPAQNPVFILPSP